MLERAVPETTWGIHPTANLYDSCAQPRLQIPAQVYRRFLWEHSQTRALITSTDIVIKQETYLSLCAWGMYVQSRKHSAWWHVREKPCIMYALFMMWQHVGKRYTFSIQANIRILNQVWRQQTYHAWFMSKYWHAAFSEGNIETVRLERRYRNCEARKAILKLWGSKAQGPLLMRIQLLRYPSTGKMQVRETHMTPRPGYTCAQDD
jgi:hypothetical protein